MKSRKEIHALVDRAFDAKEKKPRTKARITPDEIGGYMALFLMLIKALTELFGSFRKPGA